MELKDKYMSTLMRRVAVGDNSILFLPIKPMVGKIDDVEFDFLDEKEDNNQSTSSEEKVTKKVFIDDAGNGFLPVNDEDFYYDDVELGYANLIDIATLLKNAPGKNIEEKLQNASSSYCDLIDSKILVSYFDDDSNRCIQTTLSLDKISKAILESTEENGKDIKDFVFDLEYVTDDVKNTDHTAENFNDKLLNFLAENDLDSIPDHTLKVLKEDIFKNKEDLEYLEEMIDEGLSRRYSKDHDEKQKMYEELFKDKKFIDTPSLIKEEYGVDTFDKNAVYKKVSSVVVSQDEQIKRMLSELQKIDIAEATGKIDNNTAILLTGSTGVGKTEMMRQIAKNIGRPLKVFDSKAITEAGYVGDDIEELMYDLYLQCNKDKSLTEKAIVYFDEVDKLGSETNEVNGRGVLDRFLKFVDGTEIRAKADKHSGSSVKINTSNMRVIFGGAFAEMYKNFKLDNKKIGFSDTDTYIKTKPDFDDFINYGMTAEFMGRCTTEIHMSDLSIDDFKKILTNSEKSEIKNQEKLFNQIGYKLEYTDEYVNEIATQAFRENTGARSLKTKVANSAWKALDFAVDHIGEYDTILFTKDTALDNEKFEYFNKEKENNVKIKVK